MSTSQHREASWSAPASILYVFSNRVLPYGHDRQPKLLVIVSVASGRPLEFIDQRILIGNCLTPDTGIFISYHMSSGRSIVCPCQVSLLFQACPLPHQMTAPLELQPQLFHCLGTSGTIHLLPPPWHPSCALDPATEALLMQLPCLGEDTGKSRVYGEHSGLKFVLSVFLVSPHSAFSSTHFTLEIPHWLTHRSWWWRLRCGKVGDPDQLTQICSHHSQVGHRWGE